MGARVANSDEVATFAADRLAGARGSVSGPVRSVIRYLSKPSRRRSTAASSTSRRLQNVNLTWLRPASALS